MTDKIDPFLVFQNSLNSLKNFINDELINDNNEKILTIDFLQKIEKENLQLLQLCKVLNSNSKFVALANSKLKAAKPDLLYKTEHIFLSDIIEVFKNNSAENAVISRFVLAYYYDVLKNSHFATENDLLQLNKLVQSKEFEKVISDIIIKNNISKKNASNNGVIMSTLLELKDSNFNVMKENFKNFILFSTLHNVDIELKEEVPLQINNEEPPNSNITLIPADDNLEKAMAELHQLVGLEKVKKDVLELINLLEIQKKREKEGLKNIEIALHTVFLGPPGTGKTSVARLLGRIFKHLGYLSKGQLYETDREGLIAGYVGQTAIKTDKALDDSVGGVLFIDEAYSLAQNQMNDFGGESINTIIKRMEDNRDDLAVIVAGYTEPMEYFINSNPGLRSRFNRYFYFEHFTCEQLISIFENFCEKSDFVLSADAKEKLTDIFMSFNDIKTESFGNARVVRNVFEKSVQNQANRLIHWTSPEGEFLRTIHAEDIPHHDDILSTIEIKTEEENSEE